MAFFETVRPAPFGAITTFRAVSVLERAVASLRNAYEAHRTQVALARLSDHELEDIGLHRGLVRDVDFKRV